MAEVLKSLGTRPERSEKAAEMVDKLKKTPEDDHHLGVNCLNTISEIGTALVARVMPISITLRAKRSLLNRPRNSGMEVFRQKQQGKHAVETFSFAKLLRRRPNSGSSTGGERALNILGELHAAEQQLVGKAVALTDGKAGTIDHVYLDDVHGLRISISGHEGRWPISTLKFIQS